MAGGKIFISYRRADSQWAAARLHDRLAQACPDDHIFMDVEHIAPGQDFVRVLADQVGYCDVFLALIGPDWLAAQPDGGRRIDDPKDFVRIEIASALARDGTLTIPVLLDGASAPTEADLPADLRPLARRQFARLTHEGFRGEVEVLIDAVRSGIDGASAPAAAPPPRRRISRRLLAAIAGAPVVIAAGVLAAQYVTRPPDPSGTPDLGVFQECDDCPEMVALPAGVFLLGSPADEEHRNESEGPQVSVTLKRFAIGRTETTLDAYLKCVAAGSCERLPSDGPPKPGMAAAGARFVDAEAFVAWLNDQVPGAPYRLPSEAEWEYAARAGTTTPYYWGDEPDRAYANLGREVCCIGHAEGPDEWKYDAPVARFRPNGFGLHDMSGNLAEWVADIHASSHMDNPGDGTAYDYESDDPWTRRRVIKGGSYTDRPWQTRSAFRSSNDREWRLHHYGFRVARDMTPR